MQNTIRKVYAHAVLSRHPYMYNYMYVVGYLSAWAENDHTPVCLLYCIQNKYCNGMFSYHCNLKYKKNCITFIHVIKKIYFNSKTVF